MKLYIDGDWYFTEKFSEELLSRGIGSTMEKVRIPHTVKETPFHYFDENIYQMISGYKRRLEVPSSWEGKRLLLTFEGVAHDATVYVNGAEAGSHHSGYTAFTIDITGLVHTGDDNEIVVRCDSNETLNTPPFGFVVDYMTYGGIYRDVYIEVKNKAYIEDVFVTTRLADKYRKDEQSEGILKAESSSSENPRRCMKSNTVSKIRVSGVEGEYEIRQSIRQKSGSVTEEEFKELGTVTENDTETESTFFTGDVELWDIENPALYEMKTELVIDGNVVDERTDTFGFRQSVFKYDGYYLNGRKLKIRGLNRHQSYPYVGYAMPASMQEYDVHILKTELGVNAVRTSHYPQSQYFLNRCDEEGLLVFTEFPGWQHIGDEAWKEQALVNLREMIEQYRNHPSIMLWGVRINESVDDDEFYEKTNALARELDPSRQTGGVRCYKKGNLLEDVFTYNDFSHVGTNKGVEKKQDVTSDMKKAYLVSEYNGHMYPTKSFDWEEHRMEHMKRHAAVLDEVARQGDIAGSFGWCMFDYNTHKDFGSGDRICYHGVMDMFRNSKLAAYLYSCFQKNEPVLELSSTMDIGEHPGCNRGDIYILTNLDSVKMYKNDIFIKEYHPEDSEYKNLIHGPIKIDDYVGAALEENEDMSHKQAEDVKALLNATAGHGLYNIPKPMWLKAGRLMLQYKMSMSDAVELYNRYIGDWGGSSKSYRLEGYRNGELVKTVEIGAMTEKRLTSTVSSTVLHDSYTYDVAAVRLQFTDDYGHVLPYANDPVQLEVSGPIEIIGPSLITLQGGMGGTYIRTIGEKGKAVLKMTTPDGLTGEIEFTVE